ncbi:MAG: ABC transporter substrate-binding protein [Acidaminococcus provencensis]|jgi:iron complex transport system substrate-binding protein|uniref:ABC transporter substrate-binding protein n=1 Tax=Acidaminococcus provencensis TaxID=2058289 RepID=UPI0023F199D3|nr:ABC transporter substrate-binding protein [Acidaminococcus provencensis]MCH4097095.1 ABC transporter substrate-binding protein [Acidaminococcus provencensis]
MKSLRFLLLLGVLLVLFGCGPTAKPQLKSGYTVVDVRGKTVTLPQEPRRIVTDSLHLDETLLTLVPAERLAAAYYLDGEPGVSFISEETKGVTPRLRDYTPEAVAGVQPDLFLASTWSDPGLIAKVEELGIPVVVCYGPSTLGQVEDNVRLMAKALRQEETGEKVVRQLEAQLTEIDRVVAQEPQPRPVGFLVSLMSRYGGTGSLYDQLTKRAGFRNGLAEAGLKNGDTLTPEAVLRADPDFFLVAQPYPEEQQDYAAIRQQFFANPAYQELRGLKHLVALPDRYVYDASPKLVYGIKAMANAAFGRKLFVWDKEPLLKGY